MQKTLAVLVAQGKTLTGLVFARESFWHITPEYTQNTQLVYLDTVEVTQPNDQILTTKPFQQSADSSSSTKPVTSSCRDYCRRGESAFQINPSFLGARDGEGRKIPRIRGTSGKAHSHVGHVHWGDRWPYIMDWGKRGTCWQGVSDAETSWRRGCTKRI